MIKDTISNVLSFPWYICTACFSVYNSHPIANGSFSKKRSHRSHQCIRCTCSSYTLVIPSSESAIEIHACTDEPRPAVFISLSARNTLADIRQPWIIFSVTLNCLCWPVPIFQSIFICTQLCIVTPPHRQRYVEQEECTGSYMEATPKLKLSDWIDVSV